MEVDVMSGTDAPVAAHRPVDGAAEGQPIGGALLLVLALLAALAPVATDLYLPAFPEMTRELSADAATVQLTLMAFLFGITFGQLAFGVLSDRRGRLVPLLAGTILCVAASAVAAMAPNIGVLIAARFVQGFTGAAGMVIGRAVISDLATGRAAARAFSLMMIVGGVAPVIAPVAGSLLVGPVGWRGILWVVCAVAVLMFIGTAAVVRESHPPHRRAEARATADAGGSPQRSLRTRLFAGNTMAFAFGFAVMMAYISASPFVYQDIIGLTPLQYGIAFGGNALGITVASAVSARLAARVPARTLLGWGVGAVFGAALALLILVVVGAPVWCYPLPIFLAVSAQGLILGNATALALAAVPQHAGTGSAALGALQFGVGAAVAPLVGLGGAHTAVPLAVTMVICGALAVGGYLLAGDRRAAA